MKSWRFLLLMAAFVFPATAQIKNQTEVLLEQTLVTEISLKELPLAAVLKYLSQKYGKEKPLNFVPIYPPEIGQTPINLELNHVPLKVVLDYIGQLAGVVFIPDTHAVRVRLRQDNAP